MPKPKSLDVEVFNGKVVAVWFGCLALPFEEHEADLERATRMMRMTRDMNERINKEEFDAMDLLQDRLEKYAYSYMYNEDGTKKQEYTYEPPSDDIEERQA